MTSTHSNENHNKTRKSCFPWSGRFILFIFKKMSPKFSSLNNLSLSVFFFFFFQVKLASQEKSDQSASQFICQSIFLWENYCISLCNWSALCVFPLASYTVLFKKGYTEVQELMKLIIFIVSSRILKREIDLFFSVTAWWWRMQDSY